MGETPDERLTEIEKQIIEHHTRYDAWWGEHWRQKEALEKRLDAIDSNAGNSMEVRVSGLEKWQSNVMGKFTIVSFLGSLAGGIVVTLFIRLLTGHP